jgi:cytidylate kinase
VTVALEAGVRVSLIVISREMGSGGTQLGRVVAQRLGYRFADRELMLEAVKRYRLREDRLSQLEEGRPSFWERFDRDREQYLAYLRAVVYSFAADDDAVLTGRAAPFFFSGVNHALRVRVTAPPAVRAARLAEEARVTLAEAEGRIESYDRDSAARLEQVLGVDCNAGHGYDVVLNTERGTLDGYAAVLAEFVRHPPFRSTPESVQALRDRAIAAQVRAELMQIPELDTPTIEVRCEAGQVYLEGVVFGPQWEARAIAAARMVTGVRSVVCKSLDPAAGYIVPR